MPPPHKGKPPTKGSRQIVEDNKNTITFYRNMIIFACLGYWTVTSVLYLEHLTAWYIVLNVFMFMIYGGCMKMMYMISKPTYSDSNQLIDSGLDLNMEGGMGEHVKDIIILASITQVLALISNYFWLLLLLLPLRAFWLLWTNVLGPWFFQEAPLETEQDDKKRKKIERKMKRMQQ